jgi:hypothetical protein
MEVPVQAKGAAQLVHTSPALESERKTVLNSCPTVSVLVRPCLDSVCRGDGNVLSVKMVD